MNFKSLYFESTLLGFHWCYHDTENCKQKLSSLQLGISAIICYSLWFKFWLKQMRGDRPRSTVWWPQTDGKHLRAVSGDIQLNTIIERKLVKNIFSLLKTLFLHFPEDSVLSNVQRVHIFPCVRKNSQITFFRPGRSWNFHASSIDALKVCMSAMQFFCLKINVG